VLSATILSILLHVFRYCHMRSYLLGQLGVCSQTVGIIDVERSGKALHISLVSWTLQLDTC
jgi:hypothetical protein